MGYVKNNYDGLVSLHKAAQLLNLKYSTLWNRVYYHHSIPEPQITIGKRSFYDERGLHKLTAKVLDLRAKGVL